MWIPIYNNYDTNMANNLNLWKLIWPSIPSMTPTPLMPSVKPFVSQKTTTNNLNLWKLTWWPVQPSLSPVIKQKSSQQQSLEIDKPFIPTKSLYITKDKVKNILDGLESNEQRLEAINTLSQKYIIEWFNDTPQAPIQYMPAEIKQWGIKWQLTQAWSTQFQPRSKSVPWTPYNLKTIWANVIPSLWNVALNIWKMITNPLQTAWAIKDIAVWLPVAVWETIASNILWKEEFTKRKENILWKEWTVYDIYKSAQPWVAGVKWVWQYFKWYADPEIRKQRIEEDPMWVLSDVASIISVWWWAIAKAWQVSKLPKLAKAWQLMQWVSKLDPYNIVAQWAIKAWWQGLNIVKKWAYYVPKMTKATLWKMTWTSSDTIGQIYQSAVEWSDEARKWLRWEIVDTDVLSSVEQWVDAIKSNRKQLYWKWYKTLVKNKSIIDTNDIGREVLQGMHDDLWITFDKDLNLDFSQSKITSRAAQQNLTDIVNDLKTWKDKTPAWLDILKQRIQDYARYTPEFAKSDRFSTMVSNKIKNKITSVVPEYKDMMKNYWQVSDLLKDIKSAISVWWNTKKNVAITKLKSVFRDNQEFRKAMIQEIEKYSGKDISWQIAWLQMSPLLPKWLAWVWAWIWATFWWLGLASSALSNPFTLIPLLLTSPRIVWELANAIWVSVNKLNKYADFIKSQFSNANTVTNLNRVVNNTNPWLPENPMDWWVKQPLVPKWTPPTLWGLSKPLPNNTWVLETSKANVKQPTPKLPLVQSTKTLPKLPVAKKTPLKQASESVKNVDKESIKLQKEQIRQKQIVTDFSEKYWIDQEKLQKVATNIKRNNPWLTFDDAVAMGKDVIEWRKFNPITKWKTTPTRLPALWTDTQKVSPKKKTPLIKATPLSKVDDALPVWEKMWNTKQIASVGESVDLTSSIKKAKSEWKTFEEFVSWLEKDKKITYHWTNVEFDEFDMWKAGTSTKAESAKKAIFFTDDADLARGYWEYANDRVINDILDQVEQLQNKWKWDEASILEAKAEKLASWPYKKPVIKKAIIDTDNVATYDAEWAWFLATDKKINDLIDQAKKDGKDVLVVKNLVDNVYADSTRSSTHTIVLNPKVIKTEAQLRTERDKLSQPPPTAIWKTLPKVDNTLLSEARKYKSADEFVEKHYKKSDIERFKKNKDYFDNEYRNSWDKEDLAKKEYWEKKIDLFEKWEPLRNVSVKIWNRQFSIETEINKEKIVSNAKNKYKEITDEYPAFEPVTVLSDIENDLSYKTKSQLRKIREQSQTWKTTPTRLPALPKK